MQATNQQMSTEVILTGLARRLVSDNLLPRETAIAACTNASRASTPIIRHLVKNKLLGSDVIATAASQEFGLPLLSIGSFNRATFPLAMVDAKLMRKHNVLPLFKRGNKLYLGVSDPSDVNAVNEIKFHTGSSVELIVVGLTVPSRNLVQRRG